MSIVVDSQYNIGHICTKQQCDSGNGNKIAIRWIDAGNRIDYTYQDLENNSNKAANIITNLNVKSGDKVFIFMQKSPDLYFCALGILKTQAILGILFSNFGKEALIDRLQDSKASVLFIKKNSLRKIQSIWPQLPDLRTIIVTDIDEDISENVLSYHRLLTEASDKFQTQITNKNTPSIVHYTSGSTGKSKGVLHIHGSILSQSSTYKKIFKIQENDIYWCTADPGWVTGVSYGIIAPFSMGITQVIYGDNFDSEKWFELLQNEKINIWYTAPTALRMVIQNEEVDYASYDLSHLRSIFCVGEPLNPAVIEWAKHTINKDIYDTWFQTETGSIMISNSPDYPIKPGSMGKPFENIDVMILDDNGNPLPEMTQGNLCLKEGWPSMFITYLNQQTTYEGKFKNGYYFTGDVAFKDQDGYYWFVSRNDDVINTGGHLVGPFEIESALLEMEEIAESGVIGVPDKLLFEKVVAYLVLTKHAEWSDELELKLRIHIANRVSTIATPQEFIILTTLPKNKSGKIMRRVLKAWYTGTDAGDISTMEE